MRAGRVGLGDAKLEDGGGAGSGGPSREAARRERGRRWRRRGVRLAERRHTCSEGAGPSAAPYVGRVSRGGRRKAGVRGGTCWRGIGHSGPEWLELRMGAPPWVLLGGKVLKILKQQAHIKKAKPNIPLVP